MKGLGNWLNRNAEFYIGFLLRATENSHIWEHNITLINVLEVYMKDGGYKYNVIVI